MSPAAAPDRIAVRASQVGFGDCILLSLHYPRRLPDGRAERHVLFDFGSTRGANRARPPYGPIADGIAQRTGGKLDVLVITHRHKDHIGGFADDGAAATLARLAPDLVLRPWTEDPAAAPDATAPADGHPHGERSRRFAAGLASARAFAAATASALAGRRGFRGELAAAAEDQAPNEEAIRRIDALAAGGRGRYLFAGQPAGLEDVLPGVEAQVLGPPTVEQWPRVAHERANDPEYWLASGGALTRMLEATAAPAAVRRGAADAVERAATDPGPVRWLVEHLEQQQLHSLLRIVEALDDALNNTSVILLLRVGRRTLLLPGDAQIENWSYALTSPDAAALRAHLDDVDLYKVGHHGSRNATPRSLYARWQQAGGTVSSVMSTLADVHGRSVRTAVPRATLVTALEQLGPLFRTDALAPDALHLDVAAPAGSKQPFAPA